MTLRPLIRGIVPGGGRTQRVDCPREEALCRRTRGSFFMPTHARKLYADESLGLELTHASTLWTPRPSTCAYRCFRERAFALPKRR
jgi:hypothetical protein